MSDRDRMTAQIAELLEASGLSPAEARAAAVDSVARLHSAAPGTSYGRLWPSHLGTVWEAAARAGRRRLVLEITAEARELEDDTGHVTARVLDAENWPDWTPEHTRQRAATDALLRHTPAPALGLPETDYMARGLDCPDVWNGEDLDVDPASVPQMPGAQELLPGVFLVPGRLETEEEAEARARAEELN